MVDFFILILNECLLDNNFGVLDEKLNTQL